MLPYLCRYTNRVVTLWYRPPELLLGKDIIDFHDSCSGNEPHWIRIRNSELPYGSVLGFGSKLFYPRPEEVSDKSSLFIRYLTTFFNGHKKLR